MHPCQQAGRGRDLGLGVGGSLGVARREETHDLDFDGDFAESDPGDEDAVKGVVSVSLLLLVRLQRGGCTNNIVMNTANHNSCALSKECESLLHSPRLISYMSPRTTNTQVAW